MLFLNVWMEFSGTRVLRNGEVWAQDSFLYLYVGGWEFFFGFFNIKFQILIFLLLEIDKSKINYIWSSREKVENEIN